MFTGRYTIPGRVQLQQQQQQAAAEAENVLPTKKNLPRGNPTLPHTRYILAGSKSQLFHQFFHQVFRKILGTFHETSMKHSEKTLKNTDQ